MEKQPVLQLKNLTKTIEKKVIVDNLSLDIYPGEVFGFLGPNGAGKTSTIRMIVGLSLSTKGEVFIQGHNLKSQFSKAIAHVGAIIENPDLYKYLTGYKNLLHFARMHKGVDHNRIMEVSKLVGLENRLHEKVGTYSLGMRQRLGLAQALLHSPSLLILDEPTNGLDPAGIREFRNYIRKLAHKENMAVFVSSHLLQEIELMCDRIGIIQNGKLLKVQNIADLKASSDMVAYFQVEPANVAISYFKEVFPDQSIQITDKGIPITTDKENISTLMKELLNLGCQVYGIQYETQTLEDKFLEITEGNKI
ncbi:ABC transporter ATP-binding protein [Bacillus sp. C1]